jgi:16S rRNA (uracil1498-N3)-methyltransferase
MSERYYVNQPLGAGLVVLQGAEAHHLGTVSRLRPGHEVFLFNGDGREYRAEIVAVGRRVVELAVREALAPARELPFALVVACPLPRGDRGQFLIEKLTELGVTAYVPLKTERSVLHPGEGRKEKLERYVIEAAKQCGRNVLMRIEPVTPLPDLLRQTTAPRRLLAHPGGAALAVPSTPAETCIAVGPEGGFAESEVEQARSAGWQLVGLGPRILRVETAAIVLAANAALGH